MTRDRSPGHRLILALLLFPVAVVAQDADHLLLSEVTVVTRSPVDLFGSPFIEIVNPTDAPIALDQVYLSTAQDASFDRFYWDIVTGEGAGGGTSGNVHARFPVGLEIAAGDTMVIAINGSAEFAEAYGYAPDLELYEDGLTPDAVPEMREALPGSIGAGLGSGGGNAPALASGSGASDSIVLYRWDGASDLVVDLDYLAYGNATSVRVDKTGVSVDGPDAGEEASIYLDDTAAADQISAGAVPTFGQSLVRTGAVESGEPQSGGNGETGHDETGEDLATSWQIGATQDPAGAPADPAPPVPIVTAGTVGAAYTDLPTAITVTALAFDDVDALTATYRVDGGDWRSASGALVSGDTWRVEIPGQAEGAVVDWYATITGSGGGASVWPVDGDVRPRSLTVEEAPDVPVAAKLLITEVNTGQNVFPFTDMTQIAREYVEVHNPNGFAVDLSDFYLTDAINYVGSTQVYWNITDGAPSQDTVGGGHFNDFTARFPDGYTLEPGQTIVVSVASSGWFERIYGRLPDIEMYEDELSVEGVPEMRPVFENPPGEPEGDSIHTPGRDDGGSSDELPKGIPELEEFFGEPLILYHWDGESATVTDVDVFMWGDSRTGDFRVGFRKTEEDGYQPDTPVADQDWFEDVDTSGNVSYSRIDADEGTQVAAGGNGVDGRDETSENWTATFELATPTPGVFLAGQPPAPDISLSVPARTFIPAMGESFPISMVSTENSETRLRILDMEGRVILTLWDSRFDGAVSTIDGFPTVVRWDGRDETFDRVRAGLYVVHLQAVDPITGERSEETAPVVVATRLE
jgi:hypothetical protein